MMMVRWIPNGLRTYCEAIKVSHSVFALPFALSAAVLASGGLPPPLLLLQIAAAAVLARTAAMSFNRWADARIDLENPRTRARALPAGLLRPGSMAAATVLASAGFVAVSASINDLAFRLSPLALAIVLGYSLTKRFTILCHFALGISLGLAPLGAWIALREDLSLVPILLALAVMAWTAGFDIIYASQDVDFDRSHALHSLPARYGIRAALAISRALHASAVALLAAVGTLDGRGGFYALAVIAVALLLAWEQSLVRPHDLSRVNLAFFTLNGFVSVGFLLGVSLDVLL